MMQPQTTRRRATVLTLMALPALMLLALAGCGTSDPVVALRDLGARVHQDRQGQVTAVVFPEGATDEDLQYLEGMDEIAELDLSGTEVTGEGLKHLTGLTSLEKLDMRNTPVGDAGLQHLAELADELPNLRTLYLGDTNVTDDGLAELAALASLKQLFLTRLEEPKPPEERSWKSAIDLGIDLAGGTNLVFEVEATEGKPITGEVMDQMVSKVGRRINPAGVEEVTVRQVGGNRIEVIMPGADPEQVERIKQRITKLGSVEFAILASQEDARHRPFIDKALTSDARDVREGGAIVGTWRRVGVDPKIGAPKDVATVITDDNGVANNAVTRIATDRYGRPLSAPNGDEVREFLLIVDRDPDRRITGERVSNVRDEIDPRTGGLAVAFNFDTRGAYLFQQLTSENSNMPGRPNNRLAILLDEESHSAPRINETISERVQISGNFTREEVEDLKNVLNAGALQRPINPDPISEFSISPTLGEDVQHKGILAIQIAGAAVVVFMVLYYGVAGVIADMCLVLNMILIMGAMALIDATFTLPGLAGIVLTIGMAVDANVLIFERIREERTRGSSLRMSIQNGFNRAFSAIIDANLTTLITAVVLYVIGTDQVRGFAVTLFIGILMSMFTALYFGRLMFDILERKRWISDLRMFNLVGTPNWNFINKKRICFVLSAVVIGGGMATFFARGEDNLDIDFSGGAMLTFEFKDQDHQTAEVRRRLEEKFGQSITLERLAGLGESDESHDSGRVFRLRTKDPDPQTEDPDVEQVKAMVAETFSQDELIYVTLDAYEPVQPSGGDDENTNTPPAADEQITWRLTFSNPMKEATVASNLQLALESIPATGDGGTGGEFTPKYKGTESLISVVGVPETADDYDRFTQVNVIAAPDLQEGDLQTALAGMQQAMAAEPRFEGVNSFASSVASEMQQSAVMAMVASMLAIVAYLWFRFQRVTFGLAAIAAVVHDVFVVLGGVAVASWMATSLGVTALGLEDFRINLPMIAAFLTIVGYSLNDTIVVFDRVREVRGKNPALTEEMINTSLNQTLSRTILTSLTTLIVVLILYFFGGEGIHGFAFCLVIGVIVGTYSTIYVASPVLIWLMSRPTAQSARATVSSQPTKTAAT